MIYFIRMAGTDFLKIGYSESPKGRLRHLQTAHPLDLDMVAKAHGSMSMERALHRHFKASKVRGEWFRIEGAVQSFLYDLTDGIDAERAIGIERLIEAAKKHGCDLARYLTEGAAI